MASHSTSSRYERAVEAEAGNDSSSQHNRKLRVGHLFMSSGARVSQTLRGVLACWEDRFRLVKWLHNFGLSFALEVDGVGYLLPYLPHAVVESGLWLDRQGRVVPSAFPLEQLSSSG